jgi:hypothetical protein
MSVLLNKNINNDIITHKIKDKFNIIQNSLVDITNEEVSALIENYFENLLYSNERIIHSDLILQIPWFIKNFDSSHIILRHLENYLKEKKISIRNNIKKGVFEIDSGLNSLVANYFEKIDTFSNLVSDNKNFISGGLLLLYTQIITEPSLLIFLKIEIANFNKSIINSIKKLMYVMKKISEVNPEIKSYDWFLFLISSSFVTVIEENNELSYPVPENHQHIIKFRKNIYLYQKIETLYSFVGNDIHIILDNINTSLFDSLIKIMKKCSLLELHYLLNNNKKLFEKIFVNKNIKDKFATNFLNFIIRNEKNIKLENIIKCVQTFKELIPHVNSTKIINTKIFEIFSNENSQNYLLDIINKNITIQENYYDTLNIIYFCSDMDNRDKFIEKYNKMLINRILHNPNIINERKYYRILTTKFYGINQIYKTNKILTDIENTLQDKKKFIKMINDNKSFQNSTNTNIDKLYNMEKNPNINLNMDYYNIINRLNVITSSYSIWDINQTEGIVGNDILTNFKSNHILTNMMNVYNKFYEFTHENKRTLNWYPHFGEIVFDLNGIEFKMLPIQFMILEYVDEMKEISKNDLINFPIFSGYNEHFRKSIISSLLLGRIIKLDENKIKINSDITNISTNYIDLFFTSSGYIDIWNNRREKELVLSREEVLSSWINHFVKKESISKIDLFCKIQKSLDLFDFNIEFLDKVINDMIIKDYIKYNEDKIEKIIW